MRPGAALKKAYSAPQLKRLSFEQASLFLVGHAWNGGDRDARGLLELMFHRAGDQAVRINYNFPDLQATRVCPDSSDNSGWKRRCGNLLRSAAKFLEQDRT
jgi:hypothetical protein